MLPISTISVKYCQVYSPDISYCSQFWFMLHYLFFFFLSHVLTLWLSIFTQQGELCTMAHRFSRIHLSRVQKRIFHQFLSDNTLLSKCLPLAWICLFKFVLRSLQRTFSCVFSYPVFLTDSVVARVWKATWGPDSEAVYFDFNSLWIINQAINSCSI